MIADLKPYPDYKESGLPWLGKVPADWEFIMSPRNRTAQEG
jgi:type I restriction enzyme S subunit